MRWTFGGFFFGVCKAVIFLIKFAQGKNPVDIRSVLFLRAGAITVLAFVINLFLYNFFSQTKSHMDKIVSQYGDVVLRKSASILKDIISFQGSETSLNNRFSCTTGLWHLSGRTVVERHGHRVPHWISRERNHKRRQNTCNKTCHSTSYNTYSRFV